jgi:hypothetical protein
MENILKRLKTMNDKVVRINFYEFSMNALVDYHQNENGEDEIYFTNNLGGRGTLDDVLNMGGYISFDLSE